MCSWLLALCVGMLSAQPMAVPLDVSKVTIGAPATVAELDLGKLKGELRQLGWSSDDTQLYVQTADGDPQPPKLHHYIVALAGGGPKASASIVSIDAQPDWAKAYWLDKSDRTAPGVPALVIDVEQKLETMKYGTGSAGAADRSSSGLGASNINTPDNVDKAATSEKLNVVRLKLLGETVSEFVNERAVPGLMFGWGPRGTGVIAYTNRDGQLKLLDQDEHKRTIGGAKDALLPAWSTEGTRLAWVQKSGRKKYVLMVAGVSKG
jgi:hypothetical protein